MASTPPSSPYVDLGMYPFPSVAWAWDELWAAVHARAPWLPAERVRSGDVHAHWGDDHCLVTHVCGTPFVTRHLDRMRLVGAFDLDIDEARPVGHYHSVLLSPHDVTLDALVGPDVHVVANAADSLSGWLSLLAATVGPGNGWPGAVTFTTAHVESIRALAAGEADLAAIDSWTLSLVAAEQPELVDALHRVGLGPRIPTPAITARASLSPEEIDEISDAFRDALAGPSTAAARAALRIRGFAPNTLDDYRATLALLPRTRHLGPGAAAR